MRGALSWPRPATMLSVLFHALFLALLAIEAPRHMSVAQQPAAVEVVMVAPAEPDPAPLASGKPTTAPPAATLKPAPPSPRTVRPLPGGRVTATDYFAASVLDDPRNRETRERLASLTSDERLIQLCNIEAIEQLRRWKADFVPDHVVAYATADPQLTSTSMEATGAAVHAGGQWYRLSFSCGTTLDLTRVASFDFRLGKPIPHEEWEQDNLPEQVDGDMTD